MDWGNGCFDVLQTECGLGGYAMLREIIVEGAPKESTIDEKIEGNRIFVSQDGVYKARKCISTETWTGQWMTMVARSPAHLC